MAVKMRLTRLGDKHSPFYRIVVSDSRKSRDGEVIDLIGNFNPLVEKDQVKIDAEKAKAWLLKGAEPTDTVRALLKQNGIEIKRAAKVKKVKKEKAEKKETTKIVKPVAKKTK